MLTMMVNDKKQPTVPYEQDTEESSSSSSSVFEEEQSTKENLISE